MNSKKDMVEIEESILDIPRETGLDVSLWRRSDDGTHYTLTEEAKNKIFFIIKWMTQNETHPLNNFNVNIVGSMTSNSYSDDSDIDLHFNSKEISEDEAEEFNKIFRADYEENFKDIFSPDDYNIGGHPIEVYFQSNPIQDLMSVGCYDVLKDEWKVGPELKDPDFDPYSEYYYQDMQYVQSVIRDIRNIILECFESAVVINNSQDEKFRQFETSHFIDRLSRAAQIFTEAREYRKVASSPETEEQAKTLSVSKEWKIADSSFKLLDKFGYLGILRTMTQCYEDIQDGSMTEIDAVTKVISAVKENFSTNDSLDEDQKMVFEELQNEGLKDIVKYAMMIGMMASPFASSAVQQQDSVRDIPKQEMQVLKRMVGDMSYVNTVNCIAWTLWTEARGEYAKEGVSALNAVASVIWNRAGGKAENFSKVIGRPKQFSWWNDYNGGFKEDSYIPQTPNAKELNNPRTKKIWDICNTIANSMMEGTFKSTIGNMNSYLNKNTADKSAVNSWGKLCNTKIGNHWFGYQRYYDGFRKRKGSAAKN